uniref:UDP-galactopyranose mutase C-terminal domain-containing protein n=1 Tax=viral metagenome TaxID=1070528 RepID=A0A6C0K7D2_9ZZZZ
MTYEVLVVGCGLSGVTIAEQFATRLNKKVLIIDKRNHIGGNVYDYVDKETGILMNEYGAHVFHTNSDRVWNYVNQFSKWERWDHEIMGLVDGRYVHIPVNITTVNTLCGQNIKTSEEMKVWLKKNQEVFYCTDNSEKVALSRVGPELYEKIFKNYTFKQWAKYPAELDTTVLARIPVRDNFDCRYFDDKYQALPSKGYTKFVQKMIDHPNITVKLDTDYFEYFDQPLASFQTVIFTGPIDRFYASKGLQPLEYRSIEFTKEIHKNVPFYQPCSIINYPGTEVPYTRIVEYKHFLNQKSQDTVIVKEITKDKGEPYYPVPTFENQNLYEKYRKFALEEKSVHFLGRLANYRYFNMDAAIMNSLEYFDKHFAQ